jgi:SAM-dependent methyltransferase
MKNVIDEIDKQRRYYAETASQYDTMHLNEKDEHFFALSFLVASLDYLQVGSILDVGSGTGRAIRYIKDHRPDLHVLGIEPVKELREVGYLRGLSDKDLIDGDATKLPFGASEFDLVCEFGVLHHVKRPEIAVSEMLRVAGKAIFISDSNNFGQGSGAGRLLKQMINLLGMWELADFIKTRGKGYTVSEGDGLAYSYSVFNNYDLKFRTYPASAVYAPVAEMASSKYL